MRTPSPQNHAAAVHPIDRSGHAPESLPNAMTWDVSSTPRATAETMSDRRRSVVTATAYTRMKKVK